MPPDKIKNALKTFFLSMAIILVGLWGYVRYLEEITVFHPSRVMRARPDHFGLPFEDIYFKTADGLTLNGWLIKSAGAKATILYLHGNAGNIGGRIEKLSLFHQLGVNVFAIDYRGYGLSQGKASEHGIYQDALAAFNYLHNRPDLSSDKLIVYGGSLGGAAAIDLASRKKINGLIVDSSFTNASDMAKILHPEVPSFFMQTKMDSLSKIKSIAVPKLFIHSQEDEVVPFRLGKKLFETAVDPKEFLEVKGKHNDSGVFSKDIWLTGVQDFLHKYNLN